MRRLVTVNDVRCPRCKAPRQHGCVTPSGNPATEPHLVRVDRFWKAVARQTLQHALDEPKPPGLREYLDEHYPIKSTKGGESE